MTFDQMNKILNAIIPHDPKVSNSTTFETSLKKEKALIIINYKKWDKLTDRIINVFTKLMNLQRWLQDHKAFPGKKYSFQQELRAAL